jgi:asparagine synthase (glutamine-hydrolysing)
VASRDTLKKIVWGLDEPVGDPASIPLFYLSEFARRRVTVALSGEGSDEIFGGYPIYRRMLAFERVNALPLARLTGALVSAFAADTKIRKYSDMLGQPLEWRYGGVGGLFSDNQARRLNPAQGEAVDHVASAYHRCFGKEALARMSYVDLTTWLPDDLLVKADRMTMANSLELRVPFLDHHLVEFASRLPAKLKIRGGISKYLLKKWAEPLLPAGIVHRTKKGFPVPLKTWFRGDLAGFAREALFTRNGAVREFLSCADIERLLRYHRHEDRSEQIYSLLVLQQWHAEFAQAASTQTLCQLV